MTWTRAVRRSTAVYTTAHTCTAKHSTAWLAYRSSSTVLVTPRSCGSAFPTQHNTKGAQTHTLTCNKQHTHTYMLMHAGDIDFEEFKQLVYDGLLLEGAIQDYEDAFNAVDNSGNGSIGE